MADKFRLRVEPTSTWDAFRADLREADGHLHQALNVAMHEAGKLMVARAREEAPSASGSTRRAIYFKVVLGGEQVELFLDRSASPQGRALNDGTETGGWDIHGSPLRFVLNGAVAYARRVHHPDFPGLHFLERGAIRAFREHPGVRLILRNAIRDALRRGPQGWTDRG